MTKISDLLQMPIGDKRGGFTLFVKTYKKRWKQGNIWWQQCICNDETGEILAEVKVTDNVSLGREIKVVIGLIVELDWQNKTRKGIKILQYTEPTQTPDEWMEQADIAFQGEIKKVRGMVKHGLTCSYIRTFDNRTPVEGVLDNALAFAENKKLSLIIDAIMEG